MFTSLNELLIQQTFGMSYVYSEVQDHGLFLGFSALCLKGERAELLQISVWEGELEEFKVCWNSGLLALDRQGQDKTMELFGL